MEEKDTRVLIKTNERFLAEEIQGFLDASGIYTMIVSDNAATSVMKAFMGSNPTESVRLVVNKNDYQKAVDLISDSPYKEVINNA